MAHGEGKRACDVRIRSLVRPTVPTEITFYPIQLYHISEVYQYSFLQQI